VISAAQALGVVPSRCAMIGDIGADVGAAAAAGARPILVPTQVTRPEEVAEAPEVVATLGDAVDLLLGGEPVTAAAPSRRLAYGPVRSAAAAGAHGAASEAVAV
jgi:beta-phosphoglucomutase-like phosphatase (HAD superfamily)